MKITKREVLVSIPVILIALIVGFFTATYIHDYINERNSPYFKALKIDNDSELYNYSNKTQVGDILSYGELKATKTVSDPLIKGKYSSIIKTKEVYTKHTRTKSYKCGNSTCRRTETYWTWDEKGTEKFNTKDYDYLDTKVKYKDLSLSWSHKHLDTVESGFNTRYVFEVLPVKFKGTLFTTTKEKEVVVNNFFYQKTIPTVIENKEKQADQYSNWFWIMWFVVTVALVFGFYYMDNDWLH